MLRITFVTHDGDTYEVEAAPGTTLMQAAVRNGVPGIEAECGGACACATCHVYVDKAWVERTGAPIGMEEDMLDYAVDVGPTSRLACQIKIRPEYDGLIVHVPESQA